MRREKSAFQTANAIHAATACLLLCGLPAGAADIAITAQAADSLAEGMGFLKSGSLRHAAISFEDAVAQKPESQAAHYYLAYTYAQLGLNEEAIKEYELAYRLNPCGKTAEYCRKALAAYGRPVAFSPVLGNGRASGQDGADPNHLTKSIIRRQAKFEKDKHKNIAEAYASSILKSVEDEVKKIKEDAEIEKEKVLRPTLSLPGMVIPNPMQYVPDLAQMRIEEIDKNAKEAEKRVRRAAEERAEHYRKLGEVRQKALDEVADNIESQLDSPRRNSPVRLQAVGTDLYTRFYGYRRSAEKLPEIRPAAARIVDFPGDAAEHSVQDAQPKPVSKKVTGKVLD